ncbi:MAG: phospholipase D-like domain-containing protein [Bradymonadia bacterium]
MPAWAQLAAFVETLSPLERDAVVRELSGAGSSNLSAGHRQVLDSLKLSMKSELLPAFRGARAAAEHYASTRETPSMVWTGMSGIRVPMRITSQVVDELIGTARRSILLVGYSLTKAAGCWEQLASLPHSVDINIIGHDLEGRESPKNEKLKYLRGVFRESLERLHLYTYPPKDMAKLHAKLLISDRQRGLVTSANFTHLGMSRNIEVGVTIGAQQAQLVWKLFEELVNHCILEEVA